jgi:hypothetical protein
MATEMMVLPALTTGQYWTKRTSPNSNASAFYAASVRTGVAFRTWARPTVQSLITLLQLPEDWDGYGAVPIQGQIVTKALTALLQVMDHDSPRPSAVPLSDGGIQLEWHRRGRHLELEFPANETPSFYYYEDGSETECEGKISRNYDRIEAYIESLK